MVGQMDIEPGVRLRLILRDDGTVERGDFRGVMSYANHTSNDAKRIAVPSGNASL